MIDILGIGSPVVDILAEVDETFVKNIDGEKGGMVLVNADELDQLVAKLGDKFVQAAGGSSGNTTFALAELGAKTAFLGKIGNDSYGNFYREAFVTAGGDGKRFKVAEQANGRCVSLITPDSERTMRTDLGAAMTLSPDEILPDDFASVKHVHVEGYLLFNRELMLTVLKQAKAAGCSISLDLASFEVVEASRDILPGILDEYIDLVFANEDEAKAFAGDSVSKPEDHARLLASHVEVAAVKIGKDGAWIAAEGKVVHTQAVQGVKAVDTTGAGDFWAAGFLFGRLRGRTPEVCAHYGSLLGAAVVSTVGAKLTKEVWDGLRQRIQ